MKEFTRTSLALPGTLFLAITIADCGGSGASSASSLADAGAAAATLAGDLSRARALAGGNGELPARAEVLALAESIEAQALREGAGARAATLHAAAARLVERVWRVEGHERDASEALEMYAAAARDPAAPGACDAALAAARLSGDVAHDASVAYAQLYRAQRRFASVHAPDADVKDAGTSCPREVEDALDRLAAFRPAQRVLDAIEVGLAGEGTALGPGAAPDNAIAMAGKAPQIVRVESWPGRDTARVVVVLDRAAPYRIGDEPLGSNGGARTFLDLDGVDLGDTPRITPGEGIVARLQVAATSTGSRVSLDVDGRAWRRSFVMHDQ